LRFGSTIAAAGTQHDEDGLEEKLLLLSWSESTLLPWEPTAEDLVSILEHLVGRPRDPAVLLPGGAGREPGCWSCVVDWRCWAGDVCAAAAGNRRPATCVASGWRCRRVPGGAGRARCLEVLGSGDWRPAKCSAAAGAGEPLEVLGVRGCAAAWRCSELADCDVRCCWCGRPSAREVGRSRLLANKPCQSCVRVVVS
jgi:hypothetical protein